MFSSSGALLKKTEYSFTYGDPAKGQIPDILYSATLGGRGFTFDYDRLGRLTERTILFNGDDGVETYTYKAKNSTYTSTVVESMTDFTGGHGGDEGIIYTLYEYLCDNYTGNSIPTIDESYYNHSIVFAAEKVRKEHIVVDFDEYFASLN